MFPNFQECYNACIVKLIPTKAHISYLKKKLNRKNKVLVTNLSLIVTAQSNENQEIEKAQALETRKHKGENKDLTNDLEEKA